MGLFTLEGEIMICLAVGLRPTPVGLRPTPVGLRPTPVGLRPTSVGLHILFPLSTTLAPKAD